MSWYTSAPPGKFQKRHIEFFPVHHSYTILPSDAPVFFILERLSEMNNNKKTASLNNLVSNCVSEKLTVICQRRSQSLSTCGYILRYLIVIYQQTAIIAVISPGRSRSHCGWWLLIDGFSRVKLYRIDILSTVLTIACRIVYCFRSSNSFPNNTHYWKWHLTTLLFPIGL
jgi:hypothetical protein